MRIDRLLRRWIEILVGLLLGALETWRARRSFAIVHSNEGFVVRHGGAEDGAIVATLTPGSPAPPEFIRTARRGLVTFELPADEIALQQINVPARAQEFLAGIVHNQIDRLSPWQGDRVAYGFSATSSRKAGSLDVRVLMTSRATVDAARAELTAMGLAVDRIFARDQESDRPVVLWSRLDGGAAAGEEARMRRSVAIAMIAFFGLAVALAGWAEYSAASMRADSETFAARSAALQRQLEGGRGPSGASSDPAERAWNLKETVPSVVAIIEALSRAIPDATYISELSLQDANVRLTGMTDDAPSLIAPLEQSGNFADVRFFAPTTRAPDGVSFVFHIEGHATSRPGSGGN